MYRNALVLVVLLIPVLLGSVSGRPLYSFSDDVFSELPEFPEDFFEVKILFDTQRITAWHLGEEYLQPELIPLWDYWSEEVYGDEDYNHFGLYGASFYPSGFDVFDIVEGDKFNISFLVRADWGIRFIQGFKIVLPKVDGLSINLVYPENRNILLSSTYPKFIPGWLQKAIIQVEVLEKKNYTFYLEEGRPDYFHNYNWSVEYGSDYISIGKLTSSNMQVNLHELVVRKEGEDQGLSIWLNISGFVLSGIIVLIVIAYLLRKYDAKRKTE